jgi:hypothetical protein
VNYGSPAALALSAPFVALVPTPDRHDYWFVGSDGGVFSYGDAAFEGSAGNLKLVAPIVGMATTSDGIGFWLVAADGGVFPYGDAAFAGSMGGKQLNAPIVGVGGNGSDERWILVGCRRWCIFSCGSAALQRPLGFAQGQACRARAPSESPAAPVAVTCWPRPKVPPTRT